MAELQANSSINSSQGSLPICIYCGRVRKPAPYRIRHGAPGPVLLCENRCCPECGGKLEARLHPATVRNGKRVMRASYWTHLEPMPLRNCPKCNNPYRPAYKRFPHPEMCTRCYALQRDRKWKAAHPEQRKEYDKRSAKRRTARVRFAKQFPPDWDDWALDSKIIGIELLRQEHISNPDLGERLDSSRLLKCPYADTWERALCGPKRGSKRAINFVGEIRKRLGKPARKDFIRSI